ncbi:MAG: LemA family protein [SAR324 cluster bacterium]|nr:LemA family protein [SAR324 cluster bacterium]
MGDETTIDREHEERIRRTRELAERLFQDEINPKKASRKKKQGPIVLIYFIGFIVFAISVLYRVNMFISLEEEVFASVGQIDVALQRRMNLFENIVNTTLNQGILEYKIVKNVADSRAGFAQNSELSGVVDNLENLEALKSSLEGASFSKLIALMEQYPEIKFSDNYSQLINNLVDLEDLLLRKRDARIEQIRIYNTAITTFPSTFLAKVTGFKRYDYFEMEQLSIHNVPMLKPTMFKRLLPESRKSP